jgi:D-alanyl-D-alanine endopeptidase (penicillin-binding protein 7)
MTRPSRALITAYVTIGVVCAGVCLPVDALAATKRTTQKAKTSQKASSTKAASTKASAASSQPVPKKKVASSAKMTRYSSSRRARLARARAARLAREMREVANPLFRVDETGEVIPEVRAAAAIVYDPATQQVLWEENADTTRSIASITKVMTAVVLLETETDLSREVVVDKVSVRGARHTYLRAGEVVRIDDLLHMMLIASDNAAARLLARSSALGYDGFIDAMNAKAAELGLEHAHYSDPSGLESANVASARDMARLIAFVANDERLASIMRKTEYRVVTSRRVVVVHNTNRLVGSEVPVEGGKTGFIRSAGYCLATLLRLPRGEQVAVVVLGARSNAGRFMETRHLFNWVTRRASTLFESQSQVPQGPDQQPEGDRPN